MRLTFFCSRPTGSEGRSPVSYCGKISSKCRVPYSIFSFQIPLLVLIPTRVIFPSSPSPFCRTSCHFFWLMSLRKVPLHSGYPGILFFFPFALGCNPKILLEVLFLSLGPFLRVRSRVIDLALYKCCSPSPEAWVSFFLLSESYLLFFLFPRPPFGFPEHDPFHLRTFLPQHSSWVTRRPSACFSAVSHFLSLPWQSSGAAGLSGHFLYVLILYPLFPCCFLR